MRMRSCLGEPASDTFFQVFLECRKLGKGRIRVEPLGLAPGGSTVTRIATAVLAGRLAAILLMELPALPVAFARFVAPLLPATLAALLTTILAGTGIALGALAAAALAAMPVAVMARRGTPDEDGLRTFLLRSLNTGLHIGLQRGLGSLAGFALRFTGAFTIRRFHDRL